MSVFNVEIGQRLRLARELLALSQHELGVVLGVTFQQIQKYEKGTNRIGFESVLRLKAELGIDLLTEHSMGTKNFLNENSSQAVFQKSELEFLQSFRKIKNPELQRTIINLVKACINID